MWNKLSGWVLVFGFGVPLLGSCGGSASGGASGSESHFLATCEESCPSGLSCVCGVCTQICDNREQCSVFGSGARCVEVDDIPTAADCDASPAQSVCEHPCSTDRECGNVGTNFRCLSGVCRDLEATQPPPGSLEVCRLPVDAGNCLAAITRFAHDSQSGQCKAFTYGGCGGNENNFGTRAECMESCAVVPAAVFACEDSSQCTLVDAPGCPCEPLVIHDRVAINSSQQAAYLSAIPIADCGACSEVPASQHTAANFRARCEAGRCVAYDVRLAE